ITAAKVAWQHACEAVRGAPGKDLIRDTLTPGPPARNGAAAAPFRQAAFIVTSQFAVQVAVNQLSLVVHGRTFSGFNLRSIHSRKVARVRLNITRTATTATPTRAAIALGLSDSS